MKLYPKRKFPDGIRPLLNVVDKFDGGQIQPATIIAQSIKNLTITNAKIATLDALKITTGYLSADRIEAGSIDAKILNVAFAKITNVQIVNADIVNLDAGKITTGSLVVARTEAKCTDPNADQTSAHTCNSPDVNHFSGKDLDDLPDGTDYERILATNISEGNIKLTSDLVADGEWYNESGVEIDASTGINIYGTNNAFTTRATKTGTIQCSVNSSGQILAGAGAVVIDANGILIKGQLLGFKQGAYGTSYILPQNNDLRLMSYGNIRADGSIIPNVDGGYDLGSASYMWGSGYINILHVPTALYIPAEA